MSNNNQSQSSPLAAYEKAVDRLEQNIPEMISRGDAALARTSVNGLINDLCGDHIDDAVLKWRLECLLCDIDGKPRPARPREADPAEKAIRNRDFTTAKSIFAEREDYDNAAAMIKMADLEHKFRVAARNFERFRDEDNRRGIERCIRDLSEFTVMLTRFNLPHNDVVALLENYKSV